MLPCAAGYSCVRQTSWFALPAVCSARFDWPASQTAAHHAVWLYSGASAWRGIPPPPSGWHTEPTKASGSSKRQCVTSLQEGFQTGLVPSPLALCPSRAPARAAAPSPCPLVSSAPLLASTRSVRSVSPGVTAARSAAVRTAPAGVFCCAGFRSPAPTNHKCLHLPCAVSEAPTLSGAAHLHEHGAGLRGDGGQLLQEALGDAQVLFQALVLCWQTQNSLLWVCRPLRKQNAAFRINNGR